jgi:pimeloyl-ACP methyl ester carboxylesterase
VDGAAPDTALLKKPLRKWNKEGSIAMNFRAETVKSGNVSLEHFYPDEEPDGTRLLFIHSAGHGSWMWKHFLPYFARRKYDSWALNLRGHYLSEPVNDWAEVGMQEYLDDIDRAVKKTGSNTVLIGHSMSGLLILKYAEFKALKGLIVSQSGAPKSILQKRGIKIKGPMPKGGQSPAPDKSRPPMRDREQVKAVLFDRDNVAEDVVTFVLDNLGEESLRAGPEIMNMEVDPANISAPVFVLGFNASKIGMQMPLDVNKVLAEEFNARDYRVIEPGGHNYMLERNWRDFAHQFETWISSV